jgi:hypothetical protein
MLLCVNEKIFALPLPKIVPEKVKAQYEIEHDYQSSKQNSASTKRVRKNIITVSKTHTPSFTRC